MASKYDEIEISDEMKDALNDPDAELAEVETTTSQTADDTSATETTNEETAKAVTEPEVEDKSFIEINGEKYDRELVMQWREDSDNKSNWQKTNTEKAQQLSKWGKLTSKINEDEEFRKHITDYYFDDPEAIKALGLDNKIDIPVEETKEDDIVDVTDMRLRALESVEEERLMESRVDKLDSEMTRLEKEHPDLLKDEKGAEFLEFAEKNAAKFSEDGMPNLERAFKEWSYGAINDQLAHYKKLEENKNRNTAVIDNSQGGVKEVKTDKKATSWRDFDMDNPDIAKYFNE